jgi:hypothetical protein
MIDPSGLFGLGSISMACAIGGALIGTTTGAYIGYSQTGQIFSGKTIGYAVLGGLAGFGIGVAVGAMIGHLSGVVMINPSTIFYTLCKVMPKIYLQSERLMHNGTLGAGGSRTLITFAGGILSGILTAIITPDEFDEAVSITSLLSVAAGTNLDIFYRMVMRYAYNVRFPDVPGFLQLAQVFVLGFNLGYFGTQSVEYWLGDE